MVAPVSGITVIVPCRNEVACISHLLDDLAAQRLDESLTVVIADGMSEDGTWELLQGRLSATSDPYRLILVQNPDRTIPHGLNRAVEAASDSVIIRLDAHGRVPTGYLSSIATAIGARRDLLVGARIEMIPGNISRMASTIALVLNSPIGSGGTASRGNLSAPRSVAHTVMSCWHRDVWIANGGFDESLLSNEDFDFDWRAGKRGCEVLSLSSPTYRLMARPNLLALAQQRWRYGWWKAVVLRRYPRSLHLRQLVPPLALLVAVPIAILSPTTFAISIGLWLIAVWTLSSRSARYTDHNAIDILARSPFAAAVIQFVWATGLIAGLVCNWPGPERRSASYP